MRSPRGHSGVAAAACCAALAAFCMAAGPATAASDVYPAGSGTFTGGAQGWEAVDASCNVPALCTASGGYDGANGNPPGSLAANTTIGLNLLTLFKSTVTLQSPDFTVARGSEGTLHLDRQFAAGSLVDLAPVAAYDVTLIDRTAGTRAEIVAETVPATAEFIGKDHAVTTKAGHTYALSITADTSSSVAGTALLGGTTSTRFDNVSVTIDPTSGNGSGSGSGGSGGHGPGSGGTLTDQQLQSLIGGSLVGPATLKGSKLTVKVRCPQKVGRACKIGVQGLLKKRKPATTNRRAKVRQGKAKKVVLKVKPRALKKVAAKKKLLFKETVQAGKARATVYKRLKLIRR
jgi:hypothetical protein